MRHTKGFTLIELMIVVVIIAILAAIAFPSYQGSVQKSRRADAKSTLLATAQILERCFTEFNKYNDANCSLVQADNTFDDFNSDDNRINGDGYYAITDTVWTGTTFTLVATAIGGQGQDTRCATFTLTHTGAKTATNTDCW